MRKLLMHDKKILLTEDDVLVEQYDETEKGIEGAIYLGQVQNIIHGLEAIFVNIGQDKNGILHFKDMVTPLEQIKPGMSILVQVAKNPMESKGAKLTEKISIVGVYNVLLTREKQVTISQKIEDQKEAKKLKTAITRELNDEYGAIIRTAAQHEGAAAKKEIKQLINTWQEIKVKAKKAEPPVVIEPAESQTYRLIKDLTPKQLDSIVVKSFEEYYYIDSILRALDMNIATEIKKEPVTSDIKKQLTQLKNTKIWLKCGGYITIEQTEALVAIDVNSGKCTGQKRKSKAFIKVNLEATQEAAKQIRLRNLRGIILIDYINADEDEQEYILKCLNEELAKDRAKTEVCGFTKLGLLEMTRKKII